MMAKPRDPDPAILRDLSLSPEGAYAGLREDTLSSLWDDLRAARAEARSLFR